MKRIQRRTRESRELKERLVFLVDPSTRDLLNALHTSTGASTGELIRRAIASVYGTAYSEENL